MAVIKSGAGVTEMTVDLVSSAARITGYKPDGIILPAYAVRNHYRAVTAVVFAAPAGTTPFFALQGSSSKTVRIISIQVSGATLTAAAYINLICQRTSTAITGGTATVLVKTPNDTTHPTSTVSLCNVYTGAPTAGTLIGTIGATRFLAGDTAPVTLVGEIGEIFFYKNHEDGLVLRGIEQGVTLSFSAAPASAVTMALECIWTEE